ncbi:MAG TPA: hypothetical protein VEY94_05360 [Patescibacteria group bacterium]|nr:hypothetical protein [Patescibacteria group bacterium]
MLSTLYHERFTPADDSTNSSKTLKPGSGRYGLDEIAIFALIAVAVFYIAVASCWFVY